MFRVLPQSVSPAHNVKGGLAWKNMVSRATGRPKQRVKKQYTVGLVNVRHGISALVFSAVSFVHMRTWLQMLPLCLWILKLPQEVHSTLVFTVTKSGNRALFPMLHLCTIVTNEC